MRIPLFMMLLSAACAAPAPKNASLEGVPADRPGKAPKKSVLPDPPPPVAEDEPTTRSFDVSPAAPASFSFTWEEQTGARAPDGHELVVSSAGVPLLYVTSSNAGPRVASVDDAPSMIAPLTTYTVYATVESAALVVRVRGPESELVVEARSLLARNETKTTIDVTLPDPSVYRAAVTLE